MTPKKTHSEENLILLWGNEAKYNASLIIQVQTPTETQKTFKKIPTAYLSL